MQRNVQFAALGHFLGQWLGVGDSLEPREALLSVLSLEGGKRHLGPPTPLAQFIQAAIAGDLQQPSLEGDIPEEDRQGQIELQIHLLEDIVDLVIVFEKAPDEAYYLVLVASDQQLKGVLIPCQSLPNQETVWNFVPL